MTIVKFEKQGKRINQNQNNDPKLDRIAQCIIVDRGDGLEAESETEESGPASLTRLCRINRIGVLEIDTPLSRKNVLILHISTLYEDSPEILHSVRDDADTR